VIFHTRQIPKSAFGEKYFSKNNFLETILRRNKWSISEKLRKSERKKIT
jgi:hypothetical protein